MRSVKRVVVSPPAQRMISDRDAVGRIVALDIPVAIESASTREWQFELTNRGSIPWPVNKAFAVKIVARWERFDGEPFGEPLTFPLPHAIYPGEPIRFSVNLPAPQFVGDFVLVVDFAQPDGPPFGTYPGSESARVTMQVVGPRRTDIDYHQVFRTANLAENHWWVVGAYHSKEQYEQSQRDRLDMLVKSGLKPDHRLLDIGCGTGQMASATQTYFTDRGGYSGTDIGAEAIAFCKANFRKPNFRFAQGGMTTVPFHEADGLHDMAIFFSVFTHTFTDETALLLAETKRLLKPDGTIICDVIVSPLIERMAGHRGEMVLNEAHFFRLAGMLGFRGTIIHRFPWNEHAERIMVMLRQ